MLSLRDAPENAQLYLWPLLMTRSLVQIIPIYNFPTRLSPVFYLFFKKKPLFRVLNDVLPQESMGLLFLHDLKQALPPQKERGTSLRHMGMGIAAARGDAQEM